MKQKLKISGKLSVALLLLLSSSGCYFTSSNPLPAGPLDQELLGVWKVADVKEASGPPGYVLFAKSQNDRLQIIIMEKYFENVEIYQGFCSKIGSEKYLNVKKVLFGKDGQSAELDADFSLVHYRIAGQVRLEMTLLNETLMKSAVKSGQLRGLLSDRENDLNLICTTGELADFLGRHKPAELLGEPLPILERTNRLPQPAAK